MLTNITNLFVFILMIFSLENCSAQTVKQTMISGCSENMIKKSENFYPAKFLGGEEAIVNFINSVKNPFVSSPSGKMNISAKLLISIDGSVDSLIFNEETVKYCPICVAELKKAVKLLPPFIPAYRLDAKNQKFFVTDDLIIDIVM